MDWRGVADLGRACVLVAALGACSNAPPGRCAAPPSTGLEHDPQRDTGFEWDKHYAERESCTFEKDASPDATLGAFPKTFQSKVAHVVVVLRENRSFDHYFGKLRPQHLPLGADADVTNPDPTPDPTTGMRGVAVPRHPSQQYCAKEVNHEWNAAHLQFDNGNLDGFVAASNTDGTNSGGHIAMGYFDDPDIHAYYWLANHFAVSESYFASALAPTMANISFYFNATACGTSENFETTVNTILDRNPFSTDCPAHHSIFDLLDQAKPPISYQVFNDGPSLLDQPAPDSGATGLTDLDPTVLQTIDAFKTAVAQEDMDPGGGHLAEVVFVEPNYGHLKGFKTQNDEHPPSNIQDGQHFTWDIINTLLTHPNVMASTVAFVTWDEHGGFYDHVTPPPACEPDALRPCDFDFKRYGFRVPLIAVSPFARPGFAGHYTADHTSILRFIEAWKGLPALTARDANAWPLFDLFDFDSPQDLSNLVFDEPAILPCPSPVTP